MINEKFLMLYNFENFDSYEKDSNWDKANRLIGVPYISTISKCCCCMLLHNPRQDFSYHIVYFGLSRYHNIMLYLLGVSLTCNWCALYFCCELILVIIGKDENKIETCYFLHPALLPNPFYNTFHEKTSRATLQGK